MLEAVLFLVGVQMMIELLAAGYRFIDLWYRISEFWTRLLARLALVLGVDAFLVMLLDQTQTAAFLWGQASYLVFHIVIFWVIKLALIALGHSRR